MQSRLSVRRWWKPIGAVCAVVVMLTGIGVSAEEPSDVDVKIKRVALFKNGLGYFTSSASLPKGATTIKMRQLPVPSHGTFWVGYPKEVVVRGIYTSMEEIEETAPARSVAQLLEANPGRKVVVSTGSKDRPAVQGTIVEVKQEAWRTESPSPYFMDIRRSPSPRRSPPYEANPLVVIRTKAGPVVLKAGSVIRADFEGDDITTSVPVKSRQPNIRMEFENATSGGEIGVSYLARGITWSPSYLIDLSDSITAKLSAKAVIINEVANLQDIHLDLVTGFPNVQFSEVNSPVAMPQDLEGFLRALTAGRGGSSGRRGVTMQQVALAAGMGSEEQYMPVPEYPTAVKGSVYEDLFLYPVKGFSLARGETACLPLFTAETLYRHIYIWEIPDMLDERERYRGDDERTSTEQVWHSCRLVNNMAMPWTTAPAEFVKDGQFTGQDICYYTAPGAETTIRVNRAMNVLAEKAEFELERKRNAAAFYGNRYDLIKINGQLKLENRLDKNVAMEVTKNLSGEVLESTPQAKDTPTAKGLQKVNPRHVLVWEIELKPGQKQTLSYTYEVYVRN